MKYAYVQTSSPVPVFQVSMTAQAFSDLGWEYVESLFIGHAIEKQSLIMSKKQQVPPTAMFLILFRKGYNEGEEIPAPPTDVQIVPPEAVPDNTLDFKKE